MSPVPGEERSRDRTAALDQLTRIWASELDGTGVRVNSVDPGDMATAMHAAALPDDDPAELAQPEDRADVFVWLAAAESAGMSGQRLEAAGFAPPSRAVAGGR